MTGSVCANGWVLGGLKSERFGGFRDPIQFGFQGFTIYALWLLLVGGGPSEYM